MELTSWNEDCLEIQLNFTNPEYVSKGISNDAISTTVQNPALFISIDSGESLSPENVRSTSEFPRQLPKGVTEADVAAQAMKA